MSLENRDSKNAAGLTTEEQIQAVLPEERADYFRDTEAKHFDQEQAVGSRFTKVKSLRELLELAIAQRGSLSGDDREWFIAAGVKPEALKAVCRYLKVSTSGEVGIVNAADLPSSTVVKVVRAKRDEHCSLVIEQPSLPTVGFGTIVIGPAEKAAYAKPEDPAPSTKEMILTVHPGLPVEPVEDDFWSEGAEIAVQDVVARLGAGVFLNVKKV